MTVAHCIKDIDHIVAQLAKIHCLHPVNWTVFFHMIRQHGFHGGQHILIVEGIADFSGLPHKGVSGFVAEGVALVVEPFASGIDPQAAPLMGRPIWRIQPGITAIGIFLHNGAVIGQSRSGPLCQCDAVAVLGQRVSVVIVVVIIGKVLAQQFVCILVCSPLPRMMR